MEKKYVSIDSWFETPKVRNKLWFLSFWGRGRVLDGRKIQVKPWGAENK